MPYLWVLLIASCAALGASTPAHAAVGSLVKSIGKAAKKVDPPPIPKKPGALPTKPARSAASAPKPPPGRLSAAKKPAPPASKTTRPAAPAELSKTKISKTKVSKTSSNLSKANIDKASKAPKNLKEVASPAAKPPQFKKLSRTGGTMVAVGTLGFISMGAYQIIGPDKVNAFFLGKEIKKETTNSSGGE